MGSTTRISLKVIFTATALIQTSTSHSCFLKKLPKPTPPPSPPPKPKNTLQVRPLEGDLRTLLC